MKQFLIKGSGAAFLFAVPLLVSAQPYFGEVDKFFTRLSGFIDNVLIPLVFTVALLVFLYGMFNYFLVQGDNEQARDTGRRMILWSIVGFVMMVSIWGIVNIVATGLFGTTQPPDIPGTPTVSGS